MTLKVVDFKIFLIKNFTSLRGEEVGLKKKKKKKCTSSGSYLMHRNGLIFCGIFPLSGLRQKRHRNCPFLCIRYEPVDVHEGTQHLAV